MHLIMYIACGESLLLSSCTQTKISELFLYWVSMQYYLSFLALILLVFLCHGFSAVPHKTDLFVSQASHVFPNSCTRNHYLFMLL